jgi:hypothetical protein
MVKADLVMCRINMKLAMQTCQMGVKLAPLMQDPDILYGNRFKEHEHFFCRM